MEQWKNDLCWWTSKEISDSKFFDLWYWLMLQSDHTLRIQVCPKKGINAIILLWGWDWDHQTYSREGYGSLGIISISLNISDGYIFVWFPKRNPHKTSTGTPRWDLKSLNYGFFPTWKIIQWRSRYVVNNHASMIFAQFYLISSSIDSGNPSKWP